MSSLERFEEVVVLSLPCELMKTTLSSVVVGIDSVRCRTHRLSSWEKPNAGEYERAEYETAP
jgi:hypothetical protein